MKLTVTALGLPPETFENCCDHPDPVVSVHNYTGFQIFAVTCDNCDFGFMDIEVRKWMP